MLGAFAGIVLLIMCPYRIYDTGFLYSLSAVFVIAIYQLVKPKMKGKYYKLKESLSFCIFYPDRDAAIDHIFSI